MSYDPHKKYKRIGECRQCGRCCNLHTCPYFRLVANQDISAGEIIEDTGIDAPIMALCLLNGKPEKAEMYGGSCVTFPSNPWQTPPKCGYSWIEEA